MNQTERKNILGCPIDDISMERVVDMCLHWIQNGRAPHQVITLNAQSVVLCHEDSQLRNAIDKAELVLADGVGVTFAAKVLRRPIRGRVVGVELTKRLLEIGARHGLRVYFLGATDDVLRRLIDVCKREHQGLVIAGYRNGYFSRDQESAIIADIKKAAPDVLLVGMPSPFKEVWIHDHLETLRVPVAFGVGGTFDVLSGVVRRAPVFMQKVGLEWFWRLMMEPRRMWKRYTFGGAKFLWLLTRFLVRRDAGKSHLVPFYLSLALECEVVLFFLSSIGA